jgi:integrase/predicted DNA-binding transcriptional regulator AlpA
MLRITKRLVDTLGPAEKERFVWDRELPGFGVRQSRAGVVTYVLQYRVEGRQRRYRIGRHGAPWTPETARTEARRLIGEVAEGRDPQSWRFECRSLPNVAQLCAVYVEEGMYACKPSTISCARGCVENHIEPLLGTRRADTLTRGDIEKMMRDIAAGKTARTVKKGRRRLARVRGGKGAANNALVILSGALNYAVAQKIRPDNPALGVKQYPGRKLDRFLSPAELARLGDVLAAATALGVESIYALAAIKLLILTGCRKNEVLTLKRTFVDWYHRCLRLPDSKTGAKVVHLGAAAMRLVEGIPEVVGNSFLLPGKKDGTHVTDLQSVWERVREAAGLEDVRIHDLRHSFASIGADLGDSMLIISKLLGHASPKTTERYTHLFDHPLKAAADRISEQIARCMGETFGGISTPSSCLADETHVAAHAESPDVAIMGAIARTEWLDTPRAAKRLGLTVGTLQTYRWMGTGPAFRKIGRRVVYAVSEVAAWKDAASCNSNVQHAA